MAQASKSVVDESIPQSFVEVMRHKDAYKLVEAMRFEGESLESLKTWELVKLSNDRNVVRTNWVFDLKRDALGNFI